MHSYGCSIGDIGTAVKGIRDTEYEILAGNCGSLTTKCVFV